MSKEERRIIWIFVLIILFIIGLANVHNSTDSSDSCERAWQTYKDTPAYANITHDESIDRCKESERSAVDQVNHANQVETDHQP